VVKREEGFTTEDAESAEFGTTDLDRLGMPDDDVLAKREVE
jgi:hypothetical protein